MIKKIVLPIVAVAVFIVAVGVFLQKSKILSTNPVSTPNPKTVTISGKTVAVEVAKTSEEREKGLSDRSSLDKDAGMLFVFEENSGNPIFWMKDMLIPLDIIWIKNDKVVKIDKNVPAPEKGTADSKLKTYSTGTFVDYVLEVNAGFTESGSIKVGDSVSFSGI
jgi:uncharacterized membrane protein (UPF0127 family)